MLRKALFPMRSAFNVIAKGHAVLSHPGIWVALGLLLLLPSLNTGPRSRFAGIEVPLYLVLIAGLIAAARRWQGLDFGRFAAPLFALGSWACGMVYELSLTVDGTGLGGIHPDTRTSFVLAQGDYIMLALITWAAVRWLRLDLTGAFFFAAGVSLTEGLVFTGVVWRVATSAQAYLTPAYLGYYFLAYASFLVVPLVIVAPRSLWAATSLFGASLPRLILLGFGAGMGVRIIWGLVYGPIATAVFDLQPPVDAP
jgi:hypothetical protein